jgi:hypothetical protein
VPAVLRNRVMLQTANAKQSAVFLDQLDKVSGSLLQLVPKLPMEGFRRAFPYVKLGDTLFNAHCEQLYAHFVHLQVIGETVWFYVEPQHMAQAKQALVILARQELAGIPYVSAEQDRVLQLFFIAKQMWPLPAQLRALGVPVGEMRLHASEVIFARGDMLHWGLNAAVRSVGMAVNHLPLSWLAFGPSKVVEDLKFFAWIAAERDHLLQCEAEFRATHVGERPLDFILGRGMLARAINLVPPSWMCPLFKAILKDMELEVQGCSVLAYRDCALSHVQLKQAKASLEEALLLIHSPPLVKLFVIAKVLLCGCQAE